MYAENEHNYESRMREQNKFRFIRSLNQSSEENE